jgi:hypothetical protein
MSKHYQRIFCLFTLLFTLPIANFGQEQGKDYLVSAIGFYNVENLFDTINTPGVRDSDFTPDGSNQWGTERYLEKLNRLGEVIAMMATEKTPDGCAVLGLAEIENREVVEDLVNTERLKSRNYEIVHYDSPDKRGIDVALIYQPKYFKVESSKSYRLNIPGREDFFTRDQLLVTGDFLGERFHFIVAHWPSRRGGEKRSSPMREAAADLARSIIDSIMVAEGDSANVIFMGDLNDDPVSKSVKVNMNTERKAQKMTPEKLFNPFEELFRKGIGTLAWRDVWNLFDQIMLTNNLVGDDFSTFKYYKAVVFNKPFLRQPSGRFEGYPYRSFAGGQYLGGYSDHFPVYIFLLREIN